MSLKCNKENIQKLADVYAYQDFLKVTPHIFS